MHAIPVAASLLAGCTGEDRVHAVGRVAGALAALCVDEVVVVGGGMDAAYMLKMLQYLECPPHLRPHFFPPHA